MEDVLRLHARPYRESEPVVCLDERPVQLLDPSRPSVPMRGGRIRRSDYEYVRAGTANVFCIVEPKTGSRLTYASANRTGKAFAHAMYRVARRYTSARRIHMIVDNLNTHRKKSLIDALGPAAGATLWKRFKIHYTPKHASWLNPAEIEASLVSRECLGQSTHRSPSHAQVSGRRLEGAGRQSRKADPLDLHRQGRPTRLSLRWNRYPAVRALVTGDRHTYSPMEHSRILPNQKSDREVAEHVRNLERRVGLVNPTREGVAVGPVRHV